MRVAIIALALSIAALGLAGFATFAAFDEDASVASDPLGTGSNWPQEDCDLLREKLWAAETICLPGGECQSLVALLQAINDNCP